MRFVRTLAGPSLLLAVLLWPSGPAAAASDQHMWVAVGGPPGWPPADYILRVGATAWHLPAQAGGGVMAALFSGSVEVAVVRRSDCSVRVKFAAPRASRWVIRFDAQGSAHVEDWTGRGMDTGPALEPDPTGACGGPDIELPFDGVARFTSNAFPGNASATSVLRISPDLNGTVRTQFLNATPGASWTLQLYDQGTCARPLHVVATLSRVVIGSDGRRMGATTLSAAGTGAVLKAFQVRKTLVLRLSSGDFHTCQRYYPRVPSPT